jgi:hypothetical protein
VVASSYPVDLAIDAMHIAPGVVSERVAARPDILSAPSPTTLRYKCRALDRRPMRLPSGFVAAAWQVDITANDGVQGVMLASTVEEIKQL